MIKRVKVNGKWPFAAVVDRNGRIVRDHVWISHKDEHHPEGRYYLEWYQGGKRRRQAIGNFEQVVDAARRKSIELNALQAGILLPSDENSTPAPGRRTIGAAIDEYLEYVRTQRSLRTYRSYCPTLDTLLRNSYGKAYVDEVTREDILKFMSDCFKRELGARTVYDKLVVVLQLFKRNGRTGLIEPNDCPDYVDTIRPIYEPEEIEMMLEQAEQDEAMLIKFLVASGCRDREVRYLLWRDIDFRHCMVRVTAKPLWKFYPKNYKERVVPLPAAMIEQLQRFRALRDGVPSQLVFPNTRGKPDSLHIDVVKRLALNASTGALLWRYATGGDVQSSPAVANGVVYVGSSDGNVYALNAGTAPGCGTLIQAWRWWTPRPV